MNGSMPRVPIRTWARPVAIVLTLAIVGIALAEFAILLQGVVANNDLGDDFLIYRSNGARWLATGELYYPEQLAGPYQNVLGHSVFYPPTALLVFVPLSLLPVPVAALIWWAGPIVVAAILLRRFQPGYIALPVLALVLAWPRTIGGLLFGNSDMWIASAVAAGLLWSWPAVFVALKPSVLPLALIGIRRRSWWVAAAAFGLVSLLFLPLWGQYLAAATNVTDLPLLVSTNFVIILAPLVVWAARRRPDPAFAP
jgi:hypothetical protein